MGEEFWRELRCVHALGGPTGGPGALFAALRSDLAEAHAREHPRGEDEDVARLGAVWEGLVARAFREANHFDGLVRELGAALHTDPAAANVDLLELLKAARYEPHHTLVLGALIDPSRAGVLGERLLRALLRLVRDAGDAEATELGRVKVSVEEARPLPGPTSRTIIPDLVVELGEAPSRTLLVLENKIGTVDHDQQLDRYRLWAEETPAARRYLVYLTPRGLPPTAVADTQTHGWRSLSYADLAVAFRAELRAAEPGPWRDVLGLYLGTVMRHVVRRPLSSPLPSTREARAALVPYLRAALGRSTDESPPR
ncbi:MAG TPA: PD-(D/E)XK nuclease family protein [Polyangiaceae bacterium]|nr:PD-(D/E)XK nuclease family protein [Polyangiaceae bacterium]